MKIVFATKVAEHLLHIEGIAKVFGVRVDFVDVLGSSFMGTAMEAVAAIEGPIILDVESLKGVFFANKLDEIYSILCERGTTVLLLMTRADEAAKNLVRSLSGGVVRGIDRVAQASVVGFPVGRGNLNGELSSHCFTRQSSQALWVTVDPDEAGEVIMTLDGATSFVKVEVGGASIFIWSTLRVFDVFRSLQTEKDFEESIDQYVPAIIFLRYAFKDEVWHNPRLTAGVVIDDPLLRQNYGFIKFPRLLESARKHGYHITLAFIPWNHWRCSTVDAQTFLNYPDCFSVCAHGNDHTDREFAAADYGSLLQKCFIAAERMARLSTKTGLNVEPIMVCPQELYSPEAMRAFADSRQFLGLANTACIPRNLNAEMQICGADLMLPAQDSFFGFPIFKRWYSHQKSLLALGLFLGKPAILAEHHEFFKNGSSDMEFFVSELGKLRPDVLWASINQIAITTRLQRRISKNKHELRFFTDTFQWEHTGEDPIIYRLYRRLPDATPVRRVEINGKAVPFTKHNGCLTFEVHADAQETLCVQIVIGAATPVGFPQSGIGYQVSVALRRVLSEFRDNVLVRNPVALKAARYLIRAMGQKGD